MVTSSLSNGQIPTERVPVVTCQLSLGSPVHHQSSSLIGHLVLTLNSHWLQVSLWSYGAQDQDQDLGQPDPLEKGSRTRAKTKASLFYCSETQRERGNEIGNINQLMTH